MLDEQCDVRHPGTCETHKSRDPNPFYPCSQTLLTIPLTPVMGKWSVTMIARHHCVYVVGTRKVWRTEERRGFDVTLNCKRAMFFLTFSHNSHLPTEAVPLEILYRLPRHNWQVALKSLLIDGVLCFLQSAAFPLICSAAFSRPAPQRKTSCALMFAAHWPLTSDGFKFYYGTKLACVSSVVRVAGSPPSWAAVNVKLRFLYGGGGVVCSFLRGGKIIRKNHTVRSSL